MNKKIFALLVVFIATVSVVSVFAYKDYVSHDFDDFTMDIHNGYNISESQGSVNQTIYDLTNDNGDKYSIVYYNTSNINGSKNTTDFVVNTVYGNLTADGTYGNLTLFIIDNGMITINCVSSDDDSKVVVIIGSEAIAENTRDTVKFK